MAVFLEGKELEEALLSYCKNATSVADPAKVATDASFEKGIGGTKADHIAEKVKLIWSSASFGAPAPLRFVDFR